MSTDELNHPDSIIDKLLSAQKLKKQQEDIVIERVDEYKKVLNSFASSPDGQFFFKYLIKFCKVFSVDNELNPARLIEDKGKRDVYLKFIRPYLDPATKKEIE